MMSLPGDLVIIEQTNESEFLVLLDNPNTHEDNVSSFYKEKLLCLYVGDVSTTSSWSPSVRVQTYHTFVFNCTIRFVRRDWCKMHSAISHASSVV